MNCDKLKENRIKKGFTQQQMANKIGYKSKGSYSVIENGYVDISISKGKMISEALGVPFAELFLDEQTEK